MEGSKNGDLQKDLHGKSYMHSNQNDAIHPQHTVQAIDG